MINSNDIKNLNNISKKKHLNISTLAFNINNLRDYKNKNIVKVLTKKKITVNFTQEALEFTRQINPQNKKNIYQHYGIYFYKLSALKKFVGLSRTKKEIREKLEQVRAMENKMKIHVLLARTFSRGIDTKDDLLKYEKILNKRHL